jgi:putative sterol carrier protein
MADPTAEFFESLRRHAHEPLLEHVKGTLRFELADDDQVEHWFVAVDNGDLAVSHLRRRADCTLRAPKRLFAGVARGEVNAMAAVLRGAVDVEGDPELLVRFQRVFPPPKQSDAAQPRPGNEAS